MNIYTVLIMVGRVGSIWARNKVARKSFQTLVSIAIMLAILHTNKSKPKDGKKRIKYKIDTQSTNRG